MAALGGAAGSGLLASDAVAQVARREDEDAPPPLLVAQASQKQPILLAGHRSHRSHSSHASHRSHYSGGGGGGGGGGGDYSSDSSATYAPPAREAPPPPPPPPKPARVSFAAYPGGRIFIDDKPIGRDVTGTLILKPGSYTIRVENRFIGSFTQQIQISDGQTGSIEITW